MTLDPSFLDYLKGSGALVLLLMLFWFGAKVLKAKGLGHKEAKNLKVDSALYLSSTHKIITLKWHECDYLVLLSPQGGTLIDKRKTEGSKG